MRIEEVQREQPWKRPVESVRRCWFDEEIDQTRFQMMFNAVAFCHPHLLDVRSMFVSSRLLAKLELFSVPAPPNVGPLPGLLRCQRMLPPYPGKPVPLDLTIAEMALIEICLQMVPWDGLGFARQAADTLEWMLKSELIEVDIAKDIERQANEAYEAGRLVDENGKAIS